MVASVNPILKLSSEGIDLSLSITNDNPPEISYLEHSIAPLKLKRNIDDIDSSTFARSGPPSKKRCVRFSDFSECKEFPADAPEVESCLECSNSTAASTRVTQNDSEALDKDACIEKDSEIFEQEKAEEIMIPTKVEDGPSLATTASEKLIVTLVKQGRISKAQVLETIQFCSSPELTKSDIIIPLEPTILKAVQAHLEKLRDRIATRGRASMLPSTSVMGPAFIPALDFLKMTIKEVLEQPTVIPATCKSQLNKTTPTNVCEPRCPKSCGNESDQSEFLRCDCSLVSA